MILRQKFLIEILYVANINGYVLSYNDIITSLECNTCDVNM